MFYGADIYPLIYTSVSETFFLGYIAVWPFLFLFFLFWFNMLVKARQNVLTERRRWFNVQERNVSRLSPQCRIVAITPARLVLGSSEAGPP